MKRMEIAGFVALLILSFLAGGTWASAQTALEGHDAAPSPRTDQFTGEDAVRDTNLPAGRPHPRGLPRRGGRHPGRRPRKHRQVVLRNPGPSREAARPERGRR